VAQLVADIYSEFVVPAILQPDLHEVLAGAQTQTGTNYSWLVKLLA
jgi:hypothetical protein